MERKRAIPKWGFGMAPISARMAGRYDLAVEAVLALLEEQILPSEVDLDLLSELKGMFNRCVRKDQWDWFSVYSQFGEPERGDMQRIASLLYALRASLGSGDITQTEGLIRKLEDANLVKYLRTFRDGGPVRDADGTSGWLYMLSTREQPKLLKIGMTTTSVFQRVRQINGATGVPFPFSARAVFRVTDAAAAERAVFELLREYRVRPDREFFEVDFAFAVRQVEQLLSPSSTDSQTDKESK
jgi:hypothetical protein